MVKKAPRQCSLLAVFVLSAPLVLLAETPTPPEPRVTATVDKALGSKRACLVTVEVSDPVTGDLLAAPNLRVVAGQAASATTSDPLRKVVVAVKVSPGCDDGTYDVTVFRRAAPVLATSGPLQPRKK